MPSKYTPELKTRTIELVLHAQADPYIACGAVSRIADEINISRETLQIWVCKHKESGTSTPPESVDLEAENRSLRKELAEFQRANEILKKVSPFFAAELVLPEQVTCNYIDAHKAEHGVVPICRALRNAGVDIAPSNYYAA